MPFKDSAARKAYVQAYYADPVNAAKKTAYDKERHARLVSEKAAYGRKWRRENAEYLREAKKEYRLLHLEQERQSKAARYLADPQGSIAKSTAWAKANPVKHRLIQKLAQAKRRALKQGALGCEFTPEQQQARFRLLGDCCLYCKGPVEEVEHFIPLTKDGRHELHNLVPSCKACNRGQGGKHSKLPQDWLPMAQYEHLSLLLAGLQ